MIKQIIKFTLLFAVLLAGCYADLATKRLAADHLQETPSMTIIEGFIEFSYTENTGTVFGLFGESQSFWKHYALISMTCISILLVLFIIWRLREASFFTLLPFFIILSGGFPNLIDRIRYGGVVDFIHIHWKDALDWPFLFNVADALICVGGFLFLIVMIIRKDDLEKVIFPKQTTKDETSDAHNE